MTKTKARPSLYKPKRIRGVPSWYFQEAKTDRLGQPVLPHLMEPFGYRRWMIGRADELLRWWMGWIDTMPGGEKVDRAYLSGMIHKMQEHIMNRAPYAVCPVCVERGSVAEPCFCRGSGWLCEIEHADYLDWLAQGSSADWINRRTPGPTPLPDAPRADVQGDDAQDDPGRYRALPGAAGDSEAVDRGERLLGLGNTTET